MLVMRRLVGYLFLTIIMLSGFQALSTCISANVAAKNASGSIARADGTTPATTFTYNIAIPIVLGSYTDPLQATIDLWIERIEATQVVQDMANSVPLVSGRQTIVRVYVRTDSPDQVKGITVSLTGIADDRELTGSPLSQVGIIYATSERGVYTSTYNFTLPSSWLNTSQISVTALVDASNIVPETNEGNNTFSVLLHVTQAPPLDLEIVPIRYTHTPNGVTYSAPGDTISSIISRMYPVPSVAVSMHQPFAFSGDLAQAGEWGRLLELVDMLKTTENAPDSRVYYGLIPSSWFSGGYAGLGFISWRTAIGLQLDNPMWGQDAGGYAAAHEIGHNLGSLHAPGCGVGSADPNWPWPNDGHTHEYGIDIGTLQVKLPTSDDIMGYCRDGGYWISSYTYRNWLNNQQLYGQAALQAQQLPQDVLYIRATLGTSDTATLKPIYHLSAIPSPVSAAGDYWVQLLDATGAELVHFPVSVKSAEGNGIDFKMISALVPIPTGAPPAVMRLMKGTSTLVERQLLNAPKLQSGLQLLTTKEGLNLHWINGQPALVRYTSDRGATWTTLGCDVIGSELTIDPTGLASGGYFEVSFADSSTPEILSGTLQ
jgi:hypothetical protein